jgi:HSP20 family protein
VPPADVYRTPAGWLVKIDLAGVQTPEIALEVQGARLTISGSRRDKVIREGWKLYQLEISYSRFERVIELPEPLEGCYCRTDYREGMLLIEISKEGDREEA